MIHSTHIIIIHWISTFYYDTYCEMQGNKDRDLHSFFCYKKNLLFP